MATVLTTKNERQAEVLGVLVERTWQQWEDGEWDWKDSNDGSWIALKDVETSNVFWLPTDIVEEQVGHPIENQVLMNIGNRPDDADEWAETQGWEVIRI